MTFRAIALTCALSLSIFPAGAQTLGEALLEGVPSIDLRLRYTNIADQARALPGDAVTLRARLGYQTAPWNGLTLATAFDLLVPVGDTAYNTTRNGKTAYPIIGDTPLTALKHLNLTHESAFGTIIAGRQRLALGSQRFLASPDWSMHGQSFDAVQWVNKTLDGLTFTYIWIDRVNRIYGETTPFDVAASAAATNQAGYYRSDSHVMNLAYTGVPGLRLEAYALLLDLTPPRYARLPVQLAAAARLDTATYGARAEYDLMLAEGLRARLIGDYARQTPHGDNPLSFGLDYGLGEAGLSWRGVGAALGYEVLSGNGAVALSTPIGMLHANNGWADIFTTTPLNGLRDFYLRGTYAWPEFLGLRSLNATVMYHDFRADRLGAGIGSEWDAQAELQLDGNVTLVAKYANYQGSGIGLGGQPDKSVFWLQSVLRY